MDFPCNNQVSLERNLLFVTKHPRKRTPMSRGESDLINELLQLRSAFTRQATEMRVLVGGGCPAQCQGSQPWPWEHAPKDLGPGIIAPKRGYPLADCWKENMCAPATWPRKECGLQVSVRHKKNAQGVCPRARENRSRGATPYEERASSLHDSTRRTLRWTGPLYMGCPLGKCTKQMRFPTCN